MAFLKFEGVGITGMAAAVPRGVVDNLDAEEAGALGAVVRRVEKTGIRWRRQAAPGVCASDLSCRAAEELLEGMGVERGTVDLLVFLSQTPDYRMPATAVVLQDRLGLGKGCAAFDVALGCSGFVYGLSVAFAMAANGPVRRVLLLNGETRTRVYSRRDPTTASLFGDAGAATLIEKVPGAGPAWFDLCSDGRRADLIKIRSGGYRHPSSAESVVERLRADGAVRSDEHAAMNHRGVMKFLVQEVPPAVSSLLARAGQKVEDFDYCVFHQANRCLNEHLRERLQIPEHKVPSCLEEFGNTSGVSIPLTLVTRLAGPLREQPRRLLLCGFGVGMSWGSAILDVGKIHVADLVEL